MDLPDGYSVRGDLSEPGPIVITGRLEGAGEAMPVHEGPMTENEFWEAWQVAEEFDLPCAGNVYRFGYYRRNPDRVMGAGR